MQRMLVAVLVVSLGAVGSAQAQHPRPVHSPSRWVLNGHSVAALGTTVGLAGAGGTGDLKTAAGLGGGVEVGYLITPRLTAYAGFELAKQGIDVAGLGGDFGLTHLEAGARLSFPVRGNKAMPYVGAWVGRRSLSTTVDNFNTGGTSDLSVSGLAAGVRGGMQYFVSPKLALDGGLSVGIGKMGNVKIDGQRLTVPGDLKNTTTTRLQFGANWYP
jgi:hypothetical protein